MIIHNPVITGSLQVNGSSVASIESLDSTSGSVAALNNATSSYALENSISGSFTSTSESLASRVASQESFSSSLDATFATDADLNLVSSSVDSLNAATSSYALENSISGSFTSVSESLADRVTTAESELGNTLVSGSAQIASDISGSFTSLSSSLVSELLKNTTDTLTGDLTVTGTITAQDLHVQEVTSSIVYSSGSNIFGTNSSNTQILYGSVGIGTDSPARLLNIVASGSGDGSNLLLTNLNDTDGDSASIGFSMLSNDTYVKGGIFFERTSNAGRGSLHLASNSNTDGTNVSISDAVLTATYDKKVGIGSASPAARLDVVGNSAGEVILKLQRDGVGSYDYFVTDDGAGGQQLFLRANTADSGFMFQPKTSGGANTNAMIIAPDGNVGIGTTSPSSSFHVNGYTTIGRYGAPHYSQSGMAYQVIRATTDNSARALLELHSGNQGTKGVVQAVGANNTVYFGTLTNSNASYGNDVEAFYFNTAGNVGLGTTNNTHKLVVKGTSAALTSDSAARFYIDRVDATQVGSLIFSTGGASTSNGWAEIGQTDANGDLYFKANASSGSFDTRMVIKGSSGKVGINTDSPAKMLEILYPSYIDKDTSEGILRLVGQSEAENSGNYLSAGTAIEFYNKWQGTAAYSVARIAGRGSQTFDGGLQFDVSQNTAAGQTNFVNAITILKDTKVGVGTSYPIRKFHVYENSDVWHTTIGGGSGELRIGGQTSSGAVIQSQTPAGGIRDLYLQRDGGNVGIGTNNPGTKLHVVGDILTTANLRLNQGQSITWNNGDNYISGISGYHIQFTTYDGSSAQQEVLRLTGGAPASGGGRVGIGTTSPTYKLQVQKTSASVPAFMVGGAYSGGPRIQTYGLDADSYAWMGLGTDMAGLPYEHSVYFPQRTGYDGVLTFGSYDGTTYSTKMIIRSTGKIGINTTDPQGLLNIHLTENADTKLVRISGASNIYKDLQWKDTTSGEMWIWSHRTDSLGNAFEAWYNNGTDWNSTSTLSLRTDGNVGLGTESSKAQLHINDGGSYNNTDTNNRLFIESSTKSPYILFSSADERDQGIHFHNTTDNAFVGRIAYQHRSAGDKMWFRVGTSSGDGQVIINSDGNLGVGTSVMNSALHVYRSSGTVGLALQSSTYYGYMFMDQTYVGFASDIGSTGHKLRVSRSAPDNAFNINSDASVSVQSSKVTLWQEIGPATTEVSFTGAHNAQLTLNPTSIPSAARFVLADVFITADASDHQNFMFSKTNVGSQKNWVNTRGQQPSGQFGTLTGQFITTLTYNGESDGYTPNYGMWYSNQHLPINSSRQVYINNYGNSNSNGYIYIIVKAFTY